MKAVLERGSVTSLLIALLVALSVASSPTGLAFAAEHAHVDPSFGKHGRTLIPIPSPTEGEAVKLRMAEGPRGEIYAYDDQVIAAYSARGVPNRRFGYDGVLSLGASIAPAFNLGGVAVDSKGRVVVAGSSEVAVPVSPELRGRLATVRRYLPDGRLDSSFGSGGSITSDLGLPLVLSWTSFPGGQPLPAPPRMTVTGVVIDPRDRPVLTGSADTVVAPCDVLFGLTPEGFVARLTTAGAVDPGFASEVVGGPWSSVDYPAIAHSGRISATVPIEPCRDLHRQALVMLGKNGGLDQSFGSGGLSSIGFGAVIALTVDHAGRILAFGQPEANESTGEGGEPFDKLARVLPDGAADPAFRKRGSTVVPLPRKGGFAALAVDGRNRPLLAGWAVPGGQQKHQRLAVERLTRAGKTDPRFGRHGLVTIGFGRAADAAAHGLLVDHHGRLILGGIVSNARGIPTSFGLVRYIPPR